MSPKDRVRSSAIAVLPAAIAIPLLMGLWAPMWATVGWVTAYMAMSMTAWAGLLWSEKQFEEVWSFALGLMFGMLPVSAYVFAPGTRFVWIAVLMAVLSIAVDVSTLRHVPKHEWRFGVLANGTLMVSALLLDVGIVAFAMVPILYILVSSGTDLRNTRRALEESFTKAERESELARDLAIRDELTGLLNRRGLDETIRRLVADGPMTVMMFDADRFKAINDGHGHAAGDQVLRQFASQMSQRLPAVWQLGRQGGDEFVAVAPGHHDAPKQVCRSIDCSVSVYGSDASLSLRLSGGLAKSSAADSADAILSKCGYAMQAAKRSGGGDLRHFDHLLQTQFDRMIALNTTSSSEAFENQPFDADFQPVVDDQGQVVGFETLCRWRRPDGTTVPPDQFLPLLIESGRMQMLNEVMLRHGLGLAARFNDLDNPPFVSVNIGSSHLGGDRLMPLVTSLLTEFAVEPGRLIIEITEGEFLDPTKEWENEATQLQNLGVQLAVDDFGSGYSNIERLSVLPISHLKFDRSLTNAMSGPLAAIAEGVVLFAKESNIKVIAEGIETEAEQAAMANIGVKFFQGYLCGYPTDCDSAEARVREALSPRDPAELLSPATETAGQAHS